MNVAIHKHKNVHLVLPLVITFVCAGASLLLYMAAPPQIPLWYSLAIEEQQLTRSEFLFLFPIAVLLMSLLHTLILSRTKLYEPQLQALLWGFIYVPLFIIVIGMIHIAMVVL